MTRDIDKRNRMETRGMIKQGILLPVMITKCKDGGMTSKGICMWIMEFQHLISKELFSSIVFEFDAPLYVSEQILDAVLLEDEIDYSLPGLINKGLMIEVQFNTKDGKTFINIVRAVPLAEEYQDSLQSFKQNQEIKVEEEKLCNEIEIGNIDEIEAYLEG